jgi:hypothetical protein
LICRVSFWLARLGGKVVSYVREKRNSVRVRGKGSKLGEPCPKVRLSQDRMPVEPFPSRKSEVRGKAQR